MFQASKTLKAFPTKGRKIAVLADMLERFVSAVDDFVATHEG